MRRRASGRSADLSDLAAAVQQARPHRVIVALAARRGQMPMQTLLRLRLGGIKVEDGVELYEKFTGKIAVEALTPSSLIFSKDYRAARFDLTLARVLGLPATAAALAPARPRSRVDRPGHQARFPRARVLHPTASGQGREGVPLGQVSHHASHLARGLRVGAGQQPSG